MNALLVCPQVNDQRSSSDNPSVTRRAEFEAAIETNFVLRKGEILGLDLVPGSVLHLAILQGRIWATMEGDPSDYVLAEGKCINFTSAGRLVIEALEDARGSVQRDSELAAINPT